LPAISKDAVKFKIFNIAKKDGGVIGGMIMGSEERYGYPGMRVYRDKLRRALLKAAEERGVEVKYGMRCTGIHNEAPSHASVAFENGEKVEADLVVGADGVNSSIRTHIHPDVKPEYTGGMFITGSFKKGDDFKIFEKLLPCVIPGPAGQFALAPMDGEVVTFFAWVDGHQRTREEWKALIDQKEELRKIISRYNSEAYPDVVHRLVTETPLGDLNCWP
jgi:2-polyprenyl-6-methoxyphenol hydroxylase-like FAD-dependent oxidoreductase